MEPTQDFNAQNILWMRGHRAQKNNSTSLPKTKDDWLNSAKKLEENIANGNFKFLGIYSSMAKGKKILSTNNIEDTLVLRKINDNIRRSYGIRQAHRSQSIRLAKKALSEWTPKGIVRIDLKSCFESITPKDVIDKLRSDGRVSYQTIELLEAFFRQAKIFGSNRYTRGLPRGVVISSTLAELYLKELDRRINLIKGIYVFIRYVDDILVMAARSPNDIHEEMASAANSLGLKFNTTKTEVRISGCKCAFECPHIAGSCPCIDKCTCLICTCELKCTHKIGSCPCSIKCICTNQDPYIPIDYLGYKLLFKSGKHISKGGACYALLATKKSIKIKSRICSALSNYRISPDFALLNDRLRFLTRNVAIDHSLKGKRLLTGLAFTHDQYEQPPDSALYDEAKLESLDKFLHTKVRQLCKQKQIAAPQTKKLMSNSFLVGFKQKHRTNFLPSRMKNIRSCWSDV